MIFNLLSITDENIQLLISAVISFGLTLIGIAGFTKFLPKDHGKELAFNGALSKGKARGAGIILIIALLIACVLCIPLYTEYIIYMAAIFLEMLSGYLDDASEEPWSELKKGLIDLVISAGTAAAFYFFNGGEVMLPVLHRSLTISPAVYIILGTILIWASINVTNCADGIDGLCTQLSLVPLAGAFILMQKIHYAGLSGIKYGCTEFVIPEKHFIWMTIFMLIAYLWFNCSPSQILMGDAGSRPLGIIIALAFMQSRTPFLFLPCALMLIIDGGLGLLKLTVLRVTKIKGFMKNIRTPVHDHARKNKGWSDTQVVTRFTLIQILVCAGFILAAVQY